MNLAAAVKFSLLIFLIPRSPLLVVRSAALQQQSSSVLCAVSQSEFAIITADGKSVLVLFVVDDH